ncbi:hypothetical protein GCM10022247_39670 [Allokutzneria multivorans]|uniref:Uncharacterized protein n=1 Tax=Allokutzneria multivorans TaxID=1142134 RepID=A0ABP7SL34_9PSEU
MAVSPLAAIIATLRVIPRELPQEGLRELARRIRDEIRPRVHAVADNGTNAENHSLHDALGLLGSAAQDFADAADQLHLCEEQIDLYRAEVFPDDVDPTITSAAGTPSTAVDTARVPHPSRWDGHALVRTLEPVWAENIRRTMPCPTKGSRQTMGTWFTAEGLGVPALSGSASTEETDAIDQLLIASPLFPQMSNGFKPGVAKHVETKGAYRMRQENITFAVVVLTAPMCRGRFRCFRAVGAILPIGSTLVVWEPDSDQPKIIEGRADS